MSKVRSEKTKKDFVRFLNEHPELRFWQSLMAFTEKNIYLDESEFLATSPQQLEDRDNQINDLGFIDPFHRENI